MVKRYVWDEEGYPPDGMELVAASDYDALKAEWMALFQYDGRVERALESAQDRIRELEFQISEIQSVRNSEAKVSEVRRLRICELEAALYEWLMNENGPVDSGLYERTYNTLGLPGRMPEYRDRYLASQSDRGSDAAGE